MTLNEAQIKIREHMAKYYATAPAQKWMMLPDGHNSQCLFSNTLKAYTATITHDNGTAQHYNIELNIESDSCQSLE